jgi:hypothetical protein
MWVETVVCTARRGRIARLRRLLEARQAMKRRCEGCLGAWVAPGIGDKNLFLVQAIFVDEKSWKNASEKVSSQLDSKDGGIESELGGPPLVGMFDAKSTDLKISD